MNDRNQGVALVTYELGRVLRVQKEWKASLEKYLEAKKLMEETGMDVIEMYQALLEDIKLVESKIEE